MQRRVPPRFEELFRSTGIFLLALSLPFIMAYVAGYLLVRLVAPAFVQRRDAARQMRNAHIRQWQHEQLAILRTRTYSELSALPPETDIPSPPPFVGERFAITRVGGDNGGVQIGVAHFRRFMGIFRAAMMPSFEMLPDGSIFEELTSDPED